MEDNTTMKAMTKKAADLTYGERTEHGRVSCMEENGQGTIAIGFDGGGWGTFHKGEQVRVFSDPDARHCRECQAHYGDSGLCDRGRPLGSPHR